MPQLMQPRGQAEQHTVVAGDTLAKIAARKCAALGWKMLARYNFGTDRPDEVQRALCETVGVKVADLPKAGEQPKPEDLALAPDADLAPKLRIPKAWTASAMAVEKTHTVKVKPLQPASAILLTALDKWFIPDHEQCELKYALQGLAECASKLSFDVYASQYCDASAWAKGLGTYTAPAAMIDVRLNSIDLAAQASARTAYPALPGDGWKGEVTTAHGMLGRKTGAATQRHINVAFSPYTAHLRYYKADADKNAHLVLLPFWPRWNEDKAKPATAAEAEGAGIKVSWNNAAKADGGVLEVFDNEGQRVHLAELAPAKLASGAQDQGWDKTYRDDVRNGKFSQAYLDDSGMPNTEVLFKSMPYVYRVTTFKRKPVADSLKIKWEVRHTAKLEQGLLEIVDGTDRVVFHKPLAKAKLGQGEQEFVWDGKYAEGLKNSEDGTEIIPADMPYRLRLQAHTGIDTPEALALVGMHTEVRIRVHKETRAPNDLRYDPWNAKSGMALTLGPLVPGDAPTAGTELTRYKLAEYGFHPGPVKAGAAADTELKTAIREFKRSAPASGGAGGTAFTRMNLDGGADEAEDGALTTALNSIRASDKRSMLGDPTKVAAHNEAPDLSADEIKDRLGDASKDIIVWVDDRQYYTKPRGSKDENNNDFLSGDPARSSFGLMNYRGAMGVGDGRAALDKAAIARPWIPLKAELGLLGRADSLYPDHDKAKVVIADAALRAKMSRAIGPLRMDWSFDELPPDIEPVNAGAYDHAKMRARKYLAWALRDKKETHDRKDTERQHSYFNCSEALGGLRPPATATYYETAFGTDTLSLQPWRAVPVSTTETVASVIHDHLCAGQVAKTDLFEPLIGAGGAYFRPSRIAGDGYRVRAEMRFEEFEGYKFPNLPALKQRYPVLPSTHSARLRLWRRASMRGYLCWSNPASGHWPGFVDAFRSLYRAGHVYMVHEGGAPRTFAVTDVFNPADPAHVTRYKNIVANNVSDAALKDMTKMSLKTGFIWPWSDQADYGYPHFSSVDLPDADVQQKFLSDDVMEKTWGKFSEALLYAILKEIEKRGVMRGHLFAEFESSNKFHLREYRCNQRASRGAPHTYWTTQRGEATDAARLNNTACPAPNCFSNPRSRTVPGLPSVLTETTRHMSYASMPLWAEGNAMGVTWLFTSSDAGTWAHEVAHHRQFEHAATAPGAQYSSGPSGQNNLHDAQANTVNWSAPGHVHTGDERWDLDCQMSYTEVDALCFCGKCLLRNRGWLIQGLGYPGPKVREPT